MILTFSGKEYCIPPSANAAANTPEPGTSDSNSGSSFPTSSNTDSKSTSDSFFSMDFISQNYENVFKDSFDAIINSPIHSADFSSKGKLVIECSVALSLNQDFKSEMFNVVSFVLSSCKNRVLLSQVK